MENNELLKLISEIKKDLATKATNEKIDELFAVLKSKDERIVALENNVIILNKSVELLTQKIDDVEARSRRGNLRIHGIPVPDQKESGEECIAKVKEVFQQLPAGTIDACSYSRAHRVGKVKINRDGVKEQAMIVGFSTWKSRTYAYKNRKLLKNHRVSIDLTSRRAQLRTLANEKVKDDPGIEFCFADINCSLCLRYVDNTYKYFNSEIELDNILRER